MPEVCGFVLACKKFFNTKPGQSLVEFAGELKKLTPQDRLELAELLEGTGEYTITDKIKAA